MRICRPYITRNGVKIYAKDQGLKAFCWEVTEEQHQAYLEKKAEKKADNQNKAKTKKKKKKPEDETE